MSFKYIATTEIDEEYISLFGSGNTPEEAFNDFINSGGFDEHCQMCGITWNDSIEVGIFSVVHRGDQAWVEDEVHPDWEWRIDEEIETKMVEHLTC